jgi:hypothetical protein
MVSSRQEECAKTTERIDETRNPNLRRWIDPSTNQRLALPAGLRHSLGTSTRESKSTSELPFRDSAPNVGPRFARHSQGRRSARTTKEARNRPSLRNPVPERRGGPASALAGDTTGPTTAPERHPRRSMAWVLIINAIVSVSLEARPSPPAIRLSGLIEVAPMKAVPRDFEPDPST